MKRILIVVDMQNDFTTGVLGNAECVAAIEPVKRLISEGIYDRIYVTLDTHQKDYLNTQEGRKLPVEHCIEGTAGWEITPVVQKELDKVEKVVYIKKPTFGSMELASAVSNDFAEDEELRVDMCGVCTGICVISNAMLIKAARPEADIHIFANACACVTPESHKTALAAMSMCQMSIEE